MDISHKNVKKGKDWFSRWFWFFRNGFFFLTENNFEEDFKYRWFLDAMASITLQAGYREDTPVRVKEQFISAQFLQPFEITTTCNPAERASSVTLHQKPSEQPPGCQPLLCSTAADLQESLTSIPFLSPYLSIVWPFKTKIMLSKTSVCLRRLKLKENK